MSKRKKHGNDRSLWLAVLVFLGFATAIAKLTVGRDIALLNPKGLIAEEQHKLLVTSTLIMVIFAALVIFFIYFFAWKYRESNQKTTYNPGAGRSKVLLVTAWVAPITVFVILASMMLPATQKLEPQKAIESDKEQLTVRVIAMRWKWLFMYPEENIASVNYLHIPVDTPVRFELTADEAPMNGFWIPHIGGMLYAMTEHINPLNLMANTVGEYQGRASEINGHGFSGMTFKTQVSSKEEFDSWVDSHVRLSSNLGVREYEQLLEPSEYEPAAVYHSPENKELFDKLIEKYEGSHDHNGLADHSGGAH